MSRLTNSGTNQGWLLACVQEAPYMHISTHTCKSVYTKYITNTTNIQIHTLFVTLVHMVFAGKASKQKRSKRSFAVRMQ